MPIVFRSGSLNFLEPSGSVLSLYRNRTRLVVCPYLRKGKKQNFVLSIRFGILLFYGSVLETAALSFSICLSIGTPRCAGRRCSISVYVLIYFERVNLYLPFVLRCVPGHLFNENKG